MTEDKVLKWANGKEWGEISHPSLGKVMTYWKKGTPCRYTYIAPRVDSEGYVYSAMYCHDEGMWIKEFMIIGEDYGRESWSFY